MMRLVGHRRWIWCRVASGLRIGQFKRGSGACSLEPGVFDAFLHFGAISSHWGLWSTWTNVRTSKVSSQTTPPAIWTRGSARLVEFKTLPLTCQWQRSAKTERITKMRKEFVWICQMCGALQVFWIRVQALSTLQGCVSERGLWNCPLLRILLEILDSSLPSPPTRQ